MIYDSGKGLQYIRKYETVGISKYEVRSISHTQ